MRLGSAAKTFGRSDTPRTSRLDSQKSIGMVIGDGWRVVLQHRWATEAKAYEMEQRVLKALRTPKSVFERVCCTRRQLESVWSASLVADGRRQASN